MRAVRARALRKLAIEIAGKNESGQKVTEKKHYWFFRTNKKTGLKEKVNYKRVVIQNTGVRRLYRVLKTLWSRGVRGDAAVEQAGEMIKA